MKRRKPGMTLDQHVKTAKRLKFVKKELTDILKLMSRTYPKAGEQGRAYRYLSKINAWLSKAQAAASELFKEEQGNGH